MNRLVLIALLSCMVCAACGADTAGRSGPSTDAADARDIEALDSADTGTDTSGSTDTSADIADPHDTGPDAPSTDVAPDSADAGPTSRCTITADTIRCERNTAVFDNGFGDYEEREVHWQIPVGQPPADGWPAVILFQGSFYSSEYYWEGVKGSAMGLYYRVATLQKLLDAGFAVITPEAHMDGSTYWDTNLPAWSNNWENAPDHHFMVDIFDAVDRGDFGKLDPDRLFAAGISSGGYMTSRMAVAYPGKFSALAIHSASYAWCGGYNCWIPSLPDDHPPTLFIHGRLDNVVPIWTMNLYEDDLSDAGVATKVVIDETAGHHWVEQAPRSILEWFETYR